MAPRKNRHRIGIQSVALKAELLLLFLRQTAIGAGIGLLLSLIFRLGYRADLVSGSLLVFTGIVFLFWRRHPDRYAQITSYIIFCVVISNLYLPILYFYCGGMASGIPILYIFTMTATALLLDNLAMWLVLGTSSIEFVLMMVFDHLHPGLIAGISNPGKMEYLLIPVSFIFVGISVGSAFRMMFRNFGESRKMNEELLHQIQDIAKTDPLTGTFDRGYLYDFLLQCIARTKSGELKQFSLIMLDIDWFKSINDRYGHLVGDDCLRGLASTVRKNLRKDDIIARYGGEEFVCVLAGADDATAYRRADKIRKAISREPMSADMQETITISAGVAQYQPGMTAEQILSAVDANLYRAKRRGRNRVVWRDGDPGVSPQLEASGAPHDRRSTDLKK